MTYRLVLAPGLYRAVWSGDPGRTHDPRTARTYPNEKAAARALAQARRWRSFPDAVIEVVS